MPQVTHPELQAKLKTLADKGLTVDAYRRHKLSRTRFSFVLYRQSRQIYEIELRLSDEQLIHLDTEMEASAIALLSA